MIKSYIYLYNIYLNLIRKLCKVARKAPSDPSAGSGAAVQQQALRHATVGHRLKELHGQLLCQKVVFRALET